MFGEIGFSFGRQVFLPCLLSILFFFCSVALAAGTGFELASYSVPERGLKQNSDKVLDDWNAMLRMYARMPEERRVHKVNRFINNHIEVADDLAIWGHKDHWATPMETLRLGQGDCEDYAIAKYFSLRTMGVAASRLRLAYVQAVTAGHWRPHMVLMYFRSAIEDPLVLDMIKPEVLPASQRTDLRQVFSFNTQGVWEGLSKQSAEVRLARWDDVVARARQEGFE